MDFFRNVLSMKNQKDEAGRIFRSLLLLLVIGAVINSIFLPSEDDSFFERDGVQEVFDEASLRYQGSLFWVKADGTREEVTAPGEYSVGIGETFVVETRLPEDFDKAAIITRASLQNLKIYVDGELRVNYDTEESRPVGSQTPSRYVICKTSSLDAGKVLRMETVSYVNGYPGKLGTVYACDRYEFWMHILKKSGLDTWLGAIIAWTGILTVCVSMALAFGFKYRFNLEYIGWLTTLAGTWIVTDSELRQMVFRNGSNVFNLCLLVIMIAPLPLVTYMNHLQKERYKTVYTWLFWGSIINILVQNILQLFDVLDYMDMLPVSHVFLGLGIFLVIVTFVLDYRRKKIAEYKIIVIGLSIFMFSVVVEVAMTYFVTIMMGIILAIGVFVFVGAAFLQTIQDAGELEKKRQEDRLAKIEADNANRAKSQFLANMSHEIRTPINSVLGMDTMILREAKDERIRQYAQSIQNAGKSLLAIVNDVLDFSKIESGKMELVYVTYDLANMMNDLVNMIRPRLTDKDISFVLEVAEDLPAKLYGDDVRIKQVITNLLTNAVKYTPTGCVTLSVQMAQTQPEDAEQVRLLFAVKDTGIGIKEEDIGKLTEEFVRIEESRNRNIEGTGLGINIIVSLLRLMNSRLMVSSVYGEGSAFSFELVQKVVEAHPIGSIEERMKEIPVAEEHRASFTMPGARLLVVDDNRMNRMVFRHLLRDMQCEVEEAESGKACLALVQQKKYDLIFMDHMMPEMDGIETYRNMQSLGEYPNAHTKVVVLTANAIYGARDTYLAQGFAEYLTKPIDVEKLEKLLLELIPKDLIQMQSDNLLPEAPGDPVVSDEPIILEASLPVIDGVNWSHAKGGLTEGALPDRKQWTDALKQFAKEAPAVAEQMEAQYREGAYDEVGRRVHTMKEAAEAWGADSLAVLAHYLEQAIQDNHRERMDCLIELFSAEWRRLGAAVSAYFENR